MTSAPDNSDPGNSDPGNSAPGSSAPGSSAPGSSAPGDPIEPDPESLREVVAIDGPSGAGKSTVARHLAARLNWLYLDTGAMYRAVTWFLLQRDVTDLHDALVVEPQLAELDLELDRDGRVLIRGRDVSAHLRSHEVESRVSAVSALDAVRSRMRALQRGIAGRDQRGLVAEGRDMGSVVFPAARWKFYLDADAAERAHRRCLDFRRQGRDVDEADVLEEILVRDRLDSSRADAPLRRADDASMIDTTGLEIDSVVERLADIVDARVDAGSGESDEGDADEGRRLGS